MSLDGKRILITGAARRVGRHLALEVAKAGADVVIHYDHSKEDAESLSREIESLGRQAFLFQADFSDAAQVATLIPRACESGVLYGLVNSASIFGTQTWENTTLEDWNIHLMVNLTTPFLLSQAFARQVPADGSGRIVNMLDWRSFRPGRDHLPYTITKSALGALTQALAVCFAPRITVNGLALGAILPPSGGKAPENITKKIPAGRWADLDEVSQALVFLLDGPAYITGEVIHVDGGRHLV
jgi:NAD(P)-dependent dehydrogenase (short-subunit alcohol dehydrogenase family)